MEMNTPLEACEKDQNKKRAKGDESYIVISFPKTEILLYEIDLDAL